MSTFDQEITDPGICVVHVRHGQRIPAELADLLKPVDAASFHEYRLPAGSEVELHYHDYDEYWWFTSGNPRVTLRNHEGIMREMTLEPGDLVACVRGVEHTLRADHELVYFQFMSVLEGCERDGHLVR
jgi:mannose-6-phosphate isomerase-like protein (cupin superfamily)